MEHEGLSDRQFELLLERLDRIAVELHTLNGRVDQQDALAAIRREISSLGESLQALAYAALGQQGPQVRRRRTG